MFTVYGDYASDPVELAEFNSVTDAITWVRGYTRGGDFGGYEVIEVIEFVEGVPQVRYREEDEAYEEYDGQPTWEQEWEDFGECYSDEYGDY